jgi:hypothetical protein
VRGLYKIFGYKVVEDLNTDKKEIVLRFFYVHIPKIFYKDVTGVEKPVHKQGKTCEAARTGSLLNHINFFK